MPASHAGRCAQLELSPTYGAGPVAAPAMARKKKAKVGGKKKAASSAEAGGGASADDGGASAGGGGEREERQCFAFANLPTTVHEHIASVRPPPSPQPRSSASLRDRVSDSRRTSGR